VGSAFSPLIRYNLRCPLSSSIFIFIFVLFFVFHFTIIAGVFACFTCGFQFIGSYHGYRIFVALVEEFKLGFPLLGALDFQLRTSANGLLFRAYVFSLSSPFLVTLFFCFGSLLFYFFAFRLLRVQFARVYYISTVQKGLEFFFVFIFC
jgi:hypothetical protein